MNILSAMLHATTIVAVTTYHLGHCYGNNLIKIDFDRAWVVSVTTYLWHCFGNWLINANPGGLEFEGKAQLFCIILVAGY